MSDLPTPRHFACSTATGSVYDYGAHVVAWTPAGAAPVLWLSELTELLSGAPIRGGVPICWPWFSLGPGGDRTPMHGVAGTRVWEFLGAQQHPEVIECRYRLDAQEVAPNGVEVVFTVAFGSTLRLALEVVNGSDRDFTYEAALHTYLAVGDVRQVSVEGLDGCAYLDKVAEGGPAMRTQHGEVRFDAETDRIYRTTGVVTVNDPVLGRRLRIERSSSADVVVWNPWAAKAASLPDVPDDGWRSMLCVEGANVADAAVRLEPGQTHTMGYEIDVLPLA